MIFYKVSAISPSEEKKIFFVTYYSDRSDAMIAYHNLIKEYYSPYPVIYKLDKIEVTEIIESQIENLGFIKFEK